MFFSSLVFQREFVKAILCEKLCKLRFESCYRSLTSVIVFLLGAYFQSNIKMRHDPLKQQYSTCGLRAPYGPMEYLKRPGTIHTVT